MKGNIEKSILLSVKNIEKEYDKNSKNTKKRFKALKGFSFDLYKGECLALVGESGSGKSTLAKLIVSVHKADKGNIYFEDKDILKLSKKDEKDIKRQIQMVFQDPYASLNPRMRIFDIIAEPIKVHKMYTNKKDLEDKVYSLLEKMGIDKEYAKRYPHQFSGGQRQRIGIARAIALSPKLLLLDEPVSALDVSIQAQILNLLKDIKEEKELSYLFISHDLSVVKFISDRIMIMYEGELMEIGDTEEIFKNPRHPYTKLLIDSIPKIDPRNNIDVEEKEDINTEKGAKCPFYNRCPNASNKCLDEKPKMRVEGSSFYCHHPLEDKSGAYNE